MGSEASLSKKTGIFARMDRIGEPRPGASVGADRKDGPGPGETSDRLRPQDNPTAAPGSHSEEPMTDFFRRLFSDDFMPHGHCCFGKPGIVRRHVVSIFRIVLPRVSPAAGEAAMIA